ncbi:transposase [Metallumcola ferriviriculae]|uniref:Transposase n=1 Tax=Metallumcola ferriviriculae TaxID=3039180 RepID=A0AAU0USN9_9FIRM|nr:transposase [Desulfitibacteraceae bacterium MK1]
MGRMPRIEFEGAIYHVIQRGNNKEFVFERDYDKQYLLMLLREMVPDMDFRLLGYVIMNNHYHLLLQRLGTPLQVLMQQFNSRYARYYNWKHERKGHVFQGRYKALLVRDESYLVAVLRYIHQNPVKAGICQEVSQYPWTSDECYRQGSDATGLINSKLILNTLSQEHSQAVAMYQDFMDTEDNTNYEKGKFIGEFEFTVAAEIAATSETDFGASGIKVFGGGIQLDQILREKCTNPSQFTLLKSGSRSRNLTPIKVTFAKEALKVGYSLEDIGAALSMSRAAVSDLLQRWRNEF